MLSEYTTENLHIFLLNWFMLVSSQKQKTAITLSADKNVTETEIFRMITVGFFSLWAVSVYWKQFAVLLYFQELTQAYVRVYSTSIKYYGAKSDQQTVGKTDR